MNKETMKKVLKAVPALKEISWNGRTVKQRTFKRLIKISGRSVYAKS